MDLIVQYSPIRTSVTTPSLGAGPPANPPVNTSTVLSLGLEPEDGPEGRCQTHLWQTPLLSRCWAAHGNAVMVKDHSQAFVLSVNRLRKEQHWLTHFPFQSPLFPPESVSLLFNFSHTHTHAHKHTHTPSLVVMHVLFRF